MNLTLENLIGPSPEKIEALKKKQKECEHFRVGRVMDFWECLECGLEFRPMEKK